MNNDTEFLQEAIRIAEENVFAGGGPFGAIIVKDGNIIGRGVNRVTANNDPTAHAEIQAIRDATNNTATFTLTGAIIYSNAEPCPMCLAAIYWSRLDGVVYGASRDDAAKAGFDDLHIHKQVCLSLSETKDISMTQLSLDENIKPFNAWKNNPNKMLY